MNRALNLLAASACAALAVSSACLAAEQSSFPFRLAKTSVADPIQLSMEQTRHGRRSGSWWRSVALGELQGLGAAQLNASTSVPIRFALVRPAGRFDCTGDIRSSNGHGTCAFAPFTVTPDDVRALQARRVALPSVILFGLVSPAPAREWAV
ncbi:MAG: hypothetical protein M3Q83_03805 [Pseudomonadota bacterium]|nr:hypothetical protein [Pseudomonadota bacterium]